MAVSEEIRGAITEVVKTSFSDAKISSVRISAGTDSDDDPVLWVYVVFDSKDAKETLDARRMSGLTRHIIKKLVEIESSDAFPLVSFISTKDAKKINFEAA